MIFRWGMFSLIKNLFNSNFLNYVTRECYNSVTNKQITQRSRYNVSSRRHVVIPIIGNGTIASRYQHILSNRNLITIDKYLSEPVIQRLTCCNLFSISPKISSYKYIASIVSKYIYKLTAIKFILNI